MSEASRALADQAPLGEQVAPVTESQAILSDADADELDVWFARHRRTLVCLYLALLSIVLIVIGAFGILFIPELPHIVFEVLTGNSDFGSVFATHVIEDRFNFSWKISLLAVVVYVALQAVILAGIGKVYLRRRPRRGYAVLSVLVISVVGALLIGALVALAVVVQQTATNKFDQTPDWFNSCFYWAVGGGWLAWMLLAISYWRGASGNRSLPRLVRALLATSWIEFSLALPVDLAARNRETCFCAIGSWVTLVVAIPVLVLAVGPALYLLYLRERALSLSEPGRARTILSQKSQLYGARAPRKVESQVAAARTVSLALIVLGFIGLQLGIFNYQRGNLYNETRTLIVAETIKKTAHTDAALHTDLGVCNSSTDSDKNNPFVPNSAAGTSSSKLVINDPSLGAITVSTNCANNTETFAVFGYTFREPKSAPFLATIAEGDDRWQSAPFSLDAGGDELRTTLADFSIDEYAGGSPVPPAQLIQMIKEKIYTRRVKLPSLDFGDFSTQTAAWIVALLSIAILVMLRNMIHQIFRSPDTGNAEEWLVLDASSFGEKIVAVAWIAAIGLSAWLATIGLILTAMDDFQIASPRPSVALVALSYLTFGAMLTLDVWAASGTVADLLRLRQLRRMLDET